MCIDSILVAPLVTAATLTAAAKGVISDSTASRGVTLPGLAKAMATTDQAYAAYIAAGFFLSAGYAVWGASTLAND